MMQKGLNKALIKTDLMRKIEEKISRNRSTSVTIQRNSNYQSFSSGDRFETSISDKLLFASKTEAS